MLVAIKAKQSERMSDLKRTKIFLIECHNVPCKLERFISKFAQSDETLGIALAIFALLVTILNFD